jgi:hypothetical protein
MVEVRLDLEMTDEGAQHRGCLQLSPRPLLVAAVGCYSCPTRSTAQAMIRR